MLAAGWFLAVGHALRGTPSPAVVGRGIGAWIRGLLLLLLPAAERLGRSFAGS